MSDPVSTRTTSSRPTVLVIVAVVVALALMAGCFLLGRGTAGSSSDSRASIDTVAARASATEHDDADIAFAQQMIPHHEQAVQMAAMAATRAGSSDVKTLAATIEAAQQPEITRMRSWLSAWGASTSGSASGSTSGMSGDMPGMSGDMPGMGMMSASDMSALSKLSGSAFDREFLTMMVGHHQGAVAMAQTELAQGRNADALGLAASIIVSQQAQIAQMQAMLG